MKKYSSCKILNFNIDLKKKKPFRVKQRKNEIRVITRIIIIVIIQFRKQKNSCRTNNKKITFTCVYPLYDFQFSSSFNTQLQHKTVRVYCESFLLLLFCQRIVSTFRI